MPVPRRVLRPLRLPLRGGLPVPQKREIPAQTATGAHALFRPSTTPPFLCWRVRCGLQSPLPLVHDHVIPEGTLAAEVPPVPHRRRVARVHGEGEEADEGGQTPLQEEPQALRRERSRLVKAGAYVPPMDGQLGKDRKEEGGRRAVATPKGKKRARAQALHR
jgi:hypothetical protein